MLTPVSRVRTLSKKEIRCIHKVTAREKSVWSGEVSADTVILGEVGKSYQVPLRSLCHRMERPEMSDSSCLPQML